MIAMSELAPKSGSRHRIAIEFKSLGVQPKDIIFMTSFEFNKDETAAKGAGKIEFYYSDPAQLNIKKHDEYLIKAGWEIDGKVKLKEFISGRFSEVEVKSYKITASIEDNGWKLEEEGTVKYTKKKRSFIMRDIIETHVKMKAVIDFGGQPDDVIDFDSAQQASQAGSVSGNCICMPNSVKDSLCTPDSQVPYRADGQHCFENKCQCCGKPTLRASTKVKGQINCATCDCDYCGKTGWELSGKCNKRLPTCNPTAANTATPSTGQLPQGAPTGTATDAPATTGDTGTGSQADVNAATPTDASAQQGMAYWDMLLKLADQTKVDLQIFVWLDTVYVQAVPKMDNPQLQIEGSQNLVLDTINLKEGDEKLPNTVKIQYGTGKKYNMAVVSNEEAVEKYGEIPTTLKADKANAAEAIALAETELGLIRRDAGLEIDCTVIGNPEWYICRWSRVHSAKYDVQTTMYVGRIDHKMSPTAPWVVDLALFEYRPTIKGAESAAGGQGTGTGAYGSNVGQIIKWVHDNIKYSFYYNCHKTPQQTLAQKSGNCCDKAALAMYLIRQNIPNPPQMVLNCHKICNGIGHCNIDMVLNGQRLVADPTCSYLNQV